jgi:hypothetical protein
MRHAAVGVKLEAPKRMKMELLRRLHARKSAGKCRSHSCDAMLALIRAGIQSCWPIVRLLWNRPTGQRPRPLLGGEGVVVIGLVKNWFRVWRDVFRNRAFFNTCRSTQYLMRTAQLLDRRQGLSALGYQLSARKPWGHSLRTVH